MADRHDLLYDEVFEERNRYRAALHRIAEKAEHVGTERVEGYASLQHIGHACPKCVAESALNSGSLPSEDA
jgi:hypothetical protein